MITIISDETFRASLRGKLGDLGDGNAAIIHVELPPRRTTYAGLEDAIRLAGTGTPVLMLTFCQPPTLASDRRFHLALSYPNVCFERLPKSSEEIVAKVAGMLDGGFRRHDNPLVRRVFALPAMQDQEIAGILHDMDHAERAEKGSLQREEIERNWIERAVRLFGNLKKDSLVDILRSAESNLADYAPLAGERFDVACCDVEGTLLHQGGMVSPDALRWIGLQEKVRPVVLWTGGNLKETDKALREAGIALPLIPKSVMRGAAVAAALDDLPPGDFVQRYGVAVQDYCFRP